MEETPVRLPPCSTTVTSSIFFVARPKQYQLSGRYSIRGRHMERMPSMERMRPPPAVFPWFRYIYRTFFISEMVDFMEPAPPSTKALS